MANELYPELFNDTTTLEVTPQLPPPKQTTGNLAAQYFGSETAGLSEQLSMVPEMKRLTKTISFAIAFASVSPFVLILANWIVVNLFSWLPIPDMVLIAFTVSASLSAVVQPIIAKILEKVVGK